MSPEALSDAALVILGHGSTKNDGSATPVWQHAAELRRRNLFAEVREAFWKQDPQVRQVLASVSAPRVFIVPLFISEGYFCSQVIPGELGFPACSELRSPRSTLDARRITHHALRSTLFYCQPVGTHESMTGVLLARARGVVAQAPFPRAPKPAETTLFIVGHGTTRHENSRKPIEHQVERLGARNEYAAVHGLFLEEEPRIGYCYQLARTRNLIVVPFFISDGLHTREDIPVLLGESRRLVQQRLANRLPTWHNPTERHGKLVWYTPAVGTEPMIADVILERVGEAA